MTWSTTEPRSVAPSVAIAEDAGGWPVGLAIVGVTCAWCSARI
jgi:hypothetical protein